MVSCCKCQAALCSLRRGALAQDQLPAAVQGMSLEQSSVDFLDGLCLYNASRRPLAGAKASKTGKPLKSPRQTSWTFLCASTPCSPVSTTPSLYWVRFLTCTCACIVCLGSDCGGWCTRVCCRQLLHALTRQLPPLHMRESCIELLLARCTIAFVA